MGKLNSDEILLEDYFGENSHFFFRNVKRHLTVEGDYLVNNRFLRLRKYGFLAEGKVIRVRSKSVVDVLYVSKVYKVKDEFKFGPIEIYVDKKILEKRLNSYL